MLSQLIVSFYAKLIEISLWLLLIMSVIGGWLSSGFMGAVIGLMIAFIVGAMFMGAFLVLEDIRKSVKAVEERKQ